MKFILPIFIFLLGCGQKEFKDVVMNLMMKKHLDPDDEFNLLD